MPPKYEISCPTCGAAPNDSCRTLKTRRVTDTHIARILAISERSGCRALRAFGRHIGCPHESKASA